jgi:hypothetical protein
MVFEFAIERFHLPEIRSLVQPLLALSGSESVRSNIGAMKRPEELAMPLFLPEWLCF